MRGERTRPQSNLDFKLMSLTYKLRDFFKPREKILQDVGIREGFQVLDYGCGPASYIETLETLVGKGGKIFALDVNPLALEAVQRLAEKKGWSNVQTILSDCDTGLPAGSMDVVLLYDILHDLENPKRVLEELQRVLKANGILSVSDHHLQRSAIVSRITLGKAFKLHAEGENTLNFSKI